MMKLKWRVALTTLFLPLIFHGTLRANGNQVETVLYLGKGNNQPLIVGLGGSEEQDRRTLPNLGRSL